MSNFDPTHDLTLEATEIVANVDDPRDLFARLGETPDPIESAITVALLALERFYARREKVAAFRYIASIDPLIRDDVIARFSASLARS